MPGDSGSWVVDPKAKSLYGHIISGYENWNSAYVSPAIHVFHDIAIRLGQQESEIKLLVNPNPPARARVPRSLHNGDSAPQTGDPQRTLHHRIYGHLDSFEPSKASLKTTGESFATTVAKGERAISNLPAELSTPSSALLAIDIPNNVYEDDVKAWFEDFEGFVDLEIYQTSFGSFALIYFESEVLATEALWLQRSRDLIPPKVKLGFCPPPPEEPDEAEKPDKGGAFFHTYNTVNASRKPERSQSSPVREKDVVLAHHGKTQHDETKLPITPDDMKNIRGNSFYSTLSQLVNRALQSK